jgi:hypothetical protein
MDLSRGLGDVYKRQGSRCPLKAGVCARRRMRKEVSRRSR